MDVRARAEVSAPPAATYAVVADLPTYPDWLGIVRRVRPEGDGWAVELGARLGPIWRTKTVRMRKTVDDAPGHVRFERAETDGRAHSPWILDVTVTGDDGGSTVDVHLHYGGSGWAALLEPVLRAEAARAARRLGAMLA